MSEQSYAQHAHRPTLTAVAAFFTVAAFILFAYDSVQAPSALALGLLLLSAGVFTLVWISRAYTVRLQDRIIRLEMLGRLTQSGRGTEFARLTTPQVVALRFAGDGELPVLVDRAIAERLSADQIKRDIRNWQPDLHRT